MEMLHVVIARRLEVDQNRHLAAELVEGVEVDLVLGAVLDRGESDQPGGETPARLPPPRPLASAERKRSACGAGMVALIGSDRPIASVMQAMVLAVPITMQVPTDGASRPLTASVSLSAISPARYFAHSRRQSVQAPSTSPLWCPTTIG